MINVMALVDQVRRIVEKHFEGKELPYHNLEHTRDFVEVVRELAEGEGIPDSDITDLEIAGWLHDTGVTEGYTNHEQRSVEHAKRILTGLSVPPDRIERICDWIRFTDVRLKPRNIYHMIMQDADAANFGREDHWEKTELIKKEFEQLGLFRGTNREWHRATMPYADKEYYTETAKRIYGPKRRENIARKKKLAGL